MANIFENKLNRKLPKNLSECITVDKAAKELFIYASRIESIAKITTSITAIIGFIVSIYFCVLTEDAFVLFLGWAITAIISYLVYYPQHLSAVQICAFATIVDNTSASTNMQMYYFSKALNEKVEIAKDSTSEATPPPVPLDLLNKQHTSQTKPQNLTKNIVYEATPSIDYVTVICPNCNKNLEFDKNTSDAVCPYCDTEFKII